MTLGVVTLGGAASLNVLDRSRREWIASALSAAAGTGARVLVLEAAEREPPVFCAGADLDDIAALEPVGALDFADEGQAMARTIARLPAIVVAAVDGACRGGGLDLALACDLVVAGDRATFAHPGARLGIVTGWGGTTALPAAMGLGAARAAFATGRVISADEAFETGLAWRRVEGGDGFRERAQLAASSLLAAMSNWAPAEVATIKRLSATRCADSGACRLLVAG